MESNTVFTDPKKKSLYEHIVLSGRVLKVTTDETVELVSGLEQLKDLESQNGNLFLDEISKVTPLLTDKIVIKYQESKPEESGNADKFPKIYWSPCSIIDFLAISGVKFNQVGTTVFEYDENNDLKLSFLGKDIAKSFDNIVVTGNVDQFNIDMLQEALQYIADRYIASKFHINELKYYNIAFDNSEGEESNSIVSINRNLKLSPRPHYKDNKEAAEDENVMKTFIKINK